MRVALISESGIRLWDVETLKPELYLSVVDPPVVRFPSIGSSIATQPRRQRRFVRMDEHTYVEKD